MTDKVEQIDYDVYPNVNQNSKEDLSILWKQYVLVPVIIVTERKIIFNTLWQYGQIVRIPLESTEFISSQQQPK